MNHIDINCDLGEGLPNDTELMNYISSCNIACGGHAGDIHTMDTAIALAMQHNVKIGAHPSYPDKTNFGRKQIAISLDELQISIEQQLRIFVERVTLQKGILHHVKAHGALYNVAAKDITVAQVLISAIKNTTNRVFLYVPFNSVLEKLAMENDIPIQYEAFIDRNYNDDGSLVSRSLENSVIHDKYKALEHLLFMIQYQKVKSISGKKIELASQTFCIHGDNKNVIDMITFIRESLPHNNIKID